MTDQTYKLHLRGFLDPERNIFSNDISGGDKTVSGLWLFSVIVITLSMQQPNFPAVALIFLISNCSLAWLRSPCPGPPALL